MNERELRGLIGKVKAGKLSTRLETAEASLGSHDAALDATAELLRLMPAPDTIARRDDLERTAAQAVANQLVDAGIVGILNFAPIVLQVPEAVTVNNVNLAIELENLSYFIQS